MLYENLDTQRTLISERRPLFSKKASFFFQGVGRDFHGSQFVVFKPLSYCFLEKIGFDVKASFARPPVAHLIKPGDITKEF